MKILLACEYGTGLRTTGRLFYMAKHFIDMGHQVCFAHHDMEVLKYFYSYTGENLTVLPTPASGNILKRARITSYGDILATFRCHEPASFKILFSCWQNILMLVKPDIVICENAPLLCLSSSPSLPLICMGDGASLLPFAKDRFPLLRPDTSSMVRAGTLLDQLNKGLIISGRGKLDRLGDIWKGKTLFINHISLLDPYLSYRPDAIYSPFYPVPEEGAGSGRDNSFFGYFYPAFPNLDTILISLASLEQKGEVYIPGASASVANYLKETSITLRTTLENSFYRHIRDKNMVFHHGGIEVAQAALFYGIPQVIFPSTLQGVSSGAILKSRGCAEVIHAHKIGINSLTGLIKNLSCQDSLQQFSQMESANFRYQYRYSNFVKIVEIIKSLPACQAV